MLYHLSLVNILNLFVNMFQKNLMKTVLATQYELSIILVW